MTTSTQHDQLRFIPVGQLTLSPLNVRKTGAENGIDELAALIRSQGLVQNLTVYEEPRKGRERRGTFPVVAGGRRWRALQLLIKQKHLTPDHEVPCLVTTYERAVEISLAENSGREEMHPADQFEAFRQLIDAGQSVEDVAARFGVTPQVVQRRLKLANVCPDFITQYREGELTLEHLMTFALTDDHGKQREAWKGLKAHERHPAALRRALTQNEISLDEPVVRFVGVKAYEKAGGLIRRDLFGEVRDGFILDAELLMKLAAEKLDKQAAELKAEGAAWVEVTPRLDYASLAAYGRVRTILREATEPEQIQLNVLSTRQRAIEAQQADAEGDKELLAALANQADDIEVEMDELREQRTIPDPAQAALAGAVVSIGHNGKVRIERGLLMPEDAKRLARKQGAQEPTVISARSGSHSAALVRRLTAHRTLALQATLAERPDVALAALTHRLVLRTFFPHGLSHESVLQIEGRDTALRPYASDLSGCPAEAALAARRETLQAGLPQDEESLLTWLCEQPQAHVLALLAFCVAVTVDGVQSDEEPSAFDSLARAAGLDIRTWWKPTAKNYLGSIPAAQTLAAVTEAVSAEAAAPLAKLKRAELVKAAEQRLAGTGWLPTVLRRADR